MYKIVNNLVDAANNNILIPSRLQLRGHTKMLPCRLSAFLHSFFLIRIIRLYMWSQMPQNLVEINSLEPFREEPINLT